MAMGTDNANEGDDEASGGNSNTTDTDNNNSNSNNNNNSNSNNKNNNNNDEDDNNDDDNNDRADDTPHDQQPTSVAATTNSENFTVPASAVEPAPATLKCRAFPHGVYSVVLSLWTGFAWLICFSQDGCDYARAYGPSIAEITNDPSTPFIDIGFSQYRAPVLNNGEWVLDMTTPCLEYNTDLVTIGAAAQFAKVASFLASVLGGAGAIFIWFSLCLFIDRIRWRGVACELLAASVLQALSFTSFASTLCQTNVCSMSYGARANLLACIMWMVSALIIFCYVPSARMTRNGSQQRSSHVEMHDRNNEAGNSSASVPGAPEII